MTTSLPQSERKHDWWCAWRSPWDCECRQFHTRMQVYWNPGVVPEHVMTPEETEDFNKRYERAIERQKA